MAVTQKRWEGVREAKKEASGALWELFLSPKVCKRGLRSWWWLYPELQRECAEGRLPGWSQVMKEKSKRNLLMWNISCGSPVRKRWWCQRAEGVRLGSPHRWDDSVMSLVAPVQEWAENIEGAGEHQWWALFWERILSSLYAEAWVGNLSIMFWISKKDRALKHFCKVSKSTGAAV